MKKHYIQIFLYILLVVLTSSCNGLFEDIYDEAPMDTEFVQGFSRSEGAANRFTLMVDARDYNTWFYINLSDLTIVPIAVPHALGDDEWDGRSGWTYNLVEGSKYTKYDFVPTSSQKDAENWDFAIHHFDIRTNGGAAATTDFSNLDGFKLTDAKAYDDKLVSDVWTTNQVITDLSGMLGYRIGYQNSMVNMPLSSMVKMDFLTPPPTYFPSGKACVMRLADGSYAALLLKNYMSPKGTKGFLTFDIIYPL